MSVLEQKISAEWRPKYKWNTQQKSIWQKIFQSKLKTKIYSNEPSQNAPKIDMKYGHNCIFCESWVTKNKHKTCSEISGMSSQPKDRDAAIFLPQILLIKPSLSSASFWFTSRTNIFQLNMQKIDHYLYELMIKNSVILNKYVAQKHKFAALQKCTSDIFWVQSAIYLGLTCLQRKMQ